MTACKGSHHRDQTLSCSTWQKKKKKLHKSKKKKKRQHYYVVASTLQLVPLSNACLLHLLNPLQNFLLNGFIHTLDPNVPLDLAPRQHHNWSNLYMLHHMIFLHTPFLVYMIYNSIAKLRGCQQLLYMALRVSLLWETG